MKNKKVCAATRVGGQAVLEGIMMKSGNRACTAVRLADGGISTNEREVSSVTKKYKILGIPILRGFINFIETLILSMSILTFSAEAQGIEEGEPSKFEKWLEKHFGKSVLALASIVGTVLGLGLAIVLFFWLPMGISKLVDTYVVELSHIWKSILEGVVKIAIFIAYIALVALMPDIRRTFEYHGAEHKSIFCHEAGLPLTVENIKKQSRFHPRCGTSFMFVMMFLGIFISACLPASLWDSLVLRVLVKLLILPITVGVGFEITIFAGTHDNFIMRILTAPGKWMQHLTTREPDDKEIECAIVALKMALPSVYPPETVFDGIELPEKPADEPAPEETSEVTENEENN